MCLWCSLICGVCETCKRICCEKCGYVLGSKQDGEKLDELDQKWGGNCSDELNFEIFDKYSNTDHKCKFDDDNIELIVCINNIEFEVCIECYNNKNNLIKPNLNVVMGKD